MTALEGDDLDQDSGSGTYKLWNIGSTNPRRSKLLYHQYGR